MYLKRLESIGFKSFAERIRVDFVQGVTAIVGPNGSGKSNVTDAIRWVLGEQSARSLRGSKMEDIIFQGSDTRSPLNVAEVTLVLNNSAQKLPLDYEEVSVTRRVYRSGVSEFYINKQPCRLKDIIDLFMDSGLGREAFSIISQGRVEEILSSKAEERRVVFEEAAGVLKYKQRKQKAEFKLAETEENVSRVNDIIYEIEQQIDPLYEQAQVAQQYLKQRETLKHKEIALIITEISTLYKQWKNLLDKLETEKLSEIQLRTTIQKHESDLEKKRQSIEVADNQIDNLQTNLLTATQLLEQYEGKKHVLQERIKHYGKDKLNLEQQLERVLKQKTHLANIVTEEKEKLEVLQMNRKEIKENIIQFEQRLSIQGEHIAEQIEEQKAEYIELLNQQAAKRNERQTIKSQRKQLTGTKTSRESKYTELIATRNSLKKRRQESYTAYANQEKQCIEEELSIKNMKEAIIKERNGVNQLQEKLSVGYQTIAKYNSRKELLEEMKEDFQGFFYGVKAVLQARKENKLQHIHGAVIELIDVPKQYVSAIETVLGGQAQHIVVQDDKAARSAIEWLKKTNKGRATFLPLASIQPRYLSGNVLEDVKKHAGFIGIASDVVNTDKSYEKAVKHLMGHVILVKTLRDANEIAQITMRRNRIVTLSGDVVNPGGSMAGGAKRKSTQSLFTRDKDLEDIKNKLTDFRERASAFELEVNSQKEKVIQMEKILDEKEYALELSQQKLQTYQSENTKIELELKSLNDQLSAHDKDEQTFNLDKQALTDRGEKIEENLNTITNKLTSTQATIDRLSKEEAELNESYDQDRQKLHELQIQLAEMEERVKNQSEKVISLEHELTETTLELDSFKQGLDELVKVHKETEDETKLSDQIKGKKDTVEQITADIQQKRSTRLSRIQQINDIERELKEQKKLHANLMKEIQTEEVKTNRLDVDLQNRLSHLQQEYTITFERARKTYKEVTDIEETKKDVNQLKYAINELGDVNVSAIEEYERVFERHTFLQVQKTDLVEAKRTLFSVIKEMDEVMKQRFGETFTRIKSEFRIVFKELFGGGHAELKLTNPDNLLDTGIDIIAQPPGKKLQHLGLLSGGEKALTAIALLFSILRVRPVPFCVLDEVEASLDEANVVRFAKYVQMHSDETQFIVITHRKGTMEEADVLYGITMQEAGVSRLISVQLEDTMELVN